MFCKCGSSSSLTVSTAIKKRVRRPETWQKENLLAVPLEFSIVFCKGFKVVALLWSVTWIVALWHLPCCWLTCSHIRYRNVLLFRLDLTDRLFLIVRLDALARMHTHAGAHARTHTHTHTTPHARARTHACAHAHIHMRARTRTHAHTHTYNAELSQYIEQN